MDLPQIEKGMTVLADHLNRITREVRSNQIVGVVGGSFMRAPGGTSLTVSGQGVVGSTTSTSVCPFQLTDASAGSTLKVNIQYGQVAGRNPDGMTPETPYNLTIAETSYIYCAVLWDTDTMTIATGSTAISFQPSNLVLVNTTATQYILVGTAVVASGAISQIINVCSAIVPNPCFLDWSTVE
jgi:hypothetical protein